MILTAAVVAVCVATAFLVARRDEPASPSTTSTTEQTKDRGYAGKFEITATDPAGNSQQATFTCAPRNSATGYLTLGDTYEACRTGIADFEVVDYLGPGKRPKLDCDAGDQLTHAGWRYVITGDLLGLRDRYVPVHEELTVKTNCDEALWRRMKAMLPES